MCILSTRSPLSAHLCKHTFVVAGSPGGEAGGSQGPAAWCPSPVWVFEPRLGVHLSPLGGCPTCLKSTVYCGRTV